jgi:hypothetical protein
MQRLLLTLATTIVQNFWDSKEVRNLIINVLQNYSKSTKSKVDDVLVELVKTKLL